MSDFQHNPEWEFAKRKRNLADGYKETKGLRNGHCNRQACQADLNGQRQSYMIDHERFTEGERLYYCHPCTLKFNEADRQFQRDMPRRCTLEPRAERPETYHSEMERLHGPDLNRER